MPLRQLDRAPIMERVKGEFGSHPQFNDIAQHTTRLLTYLADKEMPDGRILVGFETKQDAVGTIAFPLYKTPSEVIHDFKTRFHLQDITEKLHNIISEGIATPVQPAPKQMPNPGFIFRLATLAKRPKGKAESENELIRLTGEATEHLDNGNVDAAIALYKKALKLDPKRMDALYNIGLAYMTINDPMNAYRYLLKANRLRLHPDSIVKQIIASGLVHVSNELGAAYGNEGNYKKAAAYFRMAIRLDKRLMRSPDNSYYVSLGGHNTNNLAKCLKKQGKLGAALKAYLKAIRQFDETLNENPTAANTIESRIAAYVDAACILNAKKRLSDAEGYYIKAIKDADTRVKSGVDPATFAMITDAYWGLGEISENRAKDDLKKKRLSDAKRSFELALNYFREANELYRTYGATYSMSDPSYAHTIEKNSGLLQRVIRNITSELTKL